MYKKHNKKITIGGKKRERACLLSDESVVNGRKDADFSVHGIPLVKVASYRYKSLSHES